MNKQKRRLLALILGGGFLVVGSLHAASKPKEKEASKAADTSGAAKGYMPKDEVFYIYSDRGSRLNHYTPSGWMGDYGDIKFNPGWKDNSPSKKKASSDNPNEGTTCMQVKYSAERKQGAGWSGIYWQSPANNWGDKKGGFNLSAYKKLTFWARGEKGKELVDKFFIGGIAGQTEEGDSDEASVSPVELTKDWKQYTIDLAGLDMSHIIGGFGFAANADVNPEGFTIYIDDVVLTK